MTETHDHYSPEQQRVFLKRAFDAAQSGEPDMARQLLRALGITDGPATASELNGFIARLYIERTEAYRDGVASQDAASVDLSRGSIPHEILRTAQQGGSSAMLQ